MAESNRVTLFKNKFQFFIKQISGVDPMKEMRSQNIVFFQQFIVFEPLLQSQCFCLSISFRQKIQTQTVKTIHNTITVLMVPKIFNKHLG